MAVAANAGPAGTVEMVPKSASNIATGERLAAGLCVVMILGGLIFGLMYW